jgi:hypothetical protein
VKGVSTVLGNLAKEVTRTKVALAAYAQMQLAPQMQTYAQSNAPWHDISSMARRGLKAGTYLKGDKIIIYIAHQVDYGVYLELAMDQKYAILDPTIEHFKAEAYANYARIMRM